MEQSCPQKKPVQAIPVIHDENRCVVGIYVVARDDNATTHHDFQQSLYIL